MTSQVTNTIIDHSHGSGPTRVRVHLKEEDAEFLMANRYQIVK